jgi:hypothetical protein
MTPLAAIVACLMLAMPVHAQQASPTPRPILNADAVLVSGDQPGPEMWLVRSPDGLRDMYVMAVLSPLPAGMTLQSSRIDAVVANAQEVIRQPYASFSVDTGWMRGLMLLPKLLGARRNPDGKQLEDLVSPAAYTRWKVLKARYIGRNKGIESWRPLFAAQELYKAAMKKSGLDNKSAVNDVLTAAIETHHPAVTVVKETITITDPKPLLKEFSRTTLDDVACFDNTMRLIETELGTMRQRANAWATGDMATLQLLPPPHQWEACSAAISEAGIGQRLGFGDVERKLEDRWMAAAEKALATNRVTFALLSATNVFGPKSYLAKLRAKGYTVMAPDDQVNADVVGGGALPP